MKLQSIPFLIPATLLVAFLPACSSAPTGESASTAQEAYTKTPIQSPTETYVCTACQVDGEQSCTEHFGNLITEVEQTCSATCPDVYPQCELKTIDRPWPQLTWFLGEFGCTQSGYWQDFANDGNLAGDSEAYALCPESDALDNWVNENPAGLGGVNPELHEAPACDACLAAAVHGWTYVFFAPENLILPRPGSCGGTGCLSLRW